MIDNGKGFDWGQVSSEYAKYRDIYPKEFYETRGCRLIETVLKAGRHVT